MDQNQLNWITAFIWNIADDVLRDVFVRGKYRDVILPMTVLRRLDAVLEPTKQAVLKMKAALDREKITNQDDALRSASGEAFYNTSPFTLRDLKSRKTQQTLRDDFITYLDGFSPNVQDILKNFEFRNQIPKLSESDGLGQLLEKFLSKDINLSPYPAGDLPALDNHAMGTVFEDLVRMFNEDNNEEAGQHWTPRDAVKLMASLMFLPVADKIESGTYLLYDCACGTGGMLTVAEETLQRIAKEHGKEVATHLFGQEINPETYAICKADLLLKGDGDAADNIAGGAAFSTLSNDQFRSRTFDFMLANPPYGKSWKTDLERMSGEGSKKDVKDPRFVIEHAGESEYSLITRSSDGQMLFLANMLSKMKHDTPLGSRIAEIHNGSSLFTGDAGQGESNIRRWIIENDWLEAIVALPLNMFYNTGISSGDESIRAALYETLGEPLFENPASVRSEVEKLVNDWGKADSEEEDEDGEADAPKKSLPEKKKKKLLNEDTWRRDAGLMDTAHKLRKELGDGLFEDHNIFLERVSAALKKLDLKPSAADLKLIVNAVSWRVEDAPRVIKRVHKPGKAKADSLRGLFEAQIDGKTCVVEYEPDSELRDFEQISFLEAPESGLPGGLPNADSTKIAIETFIRREVLPYTPDAWIVEGDTKIGYEISFTRHFYQPPKLRTLSEISANIVKLQDKTEGLLTEITKGVQR